MTRKEFEKAVSDRYGYKIHSDGLFKRLDTKIKCAPQQNGQPPLPDVDIDDSEIPF